MNASSFVTTATTQELHFRQSAPAFPIPGSRPIALEELRQHVPVLRRRLAAGQFLFRAGQPFKAIFLIHSGSDNARATRCQVDSIETSRNSPFSRRRNHSSHASTAAGSRNGEKRCLSNFVAGMMRIPGRVLPPTALRD